MFSFFCILQVDPRSLDELKNWHKNSNIKNLLTGVRKMMQMKENMKLAQPPDGATFSCPGLWVWYTGVFKPDQHHSRLLRCTLGSGQQLRKSEQNGFHDNFLIYRPNPMIWPSLKSSLRDNSNEWSHHRVLLRNEKVIILKTLNFRPYLLPSSVRNKRWQVFIMSTFSKHLFSKINYK